MVSVALFLLLFFIHLLLLFINVVVIIVAVVSFVILVLFPPSFCRLVLLVLRMPVIGPVLLSCSPPSHDFFLVAGKEAIIKGAMQTTMCVLFSQFYGLFFFTYCIFLLFLFPCYHFCHIGMIFAEVAPAAKR